MLLVSLIACVIGTYAAPATDADVLKKFYRNVKPWGFWKPIHEQVVAEDPSFVKNTGFKKDMLNVVVGIIWQTSLVIFPIYLVLMEVVPLVVSIAVVIACSLILKKTWYDKLPKDKT